jgi:hypothetical protein
MTYYGMVHSLKKILFANLAICATGAVKREAFQRKIFTFHVSRFTPQESYALAYI